MMRSFLYRDYRKLAMLAIIFAAAFTSYGSPNHAPYFYSLSNTISPCGNSVYPVNSSLPAVDADAGQTITWSLAQAPAHGTAAIAYSTVSTGGRLDPSGLTYTPQQGYAGSDAFKVRVSDGALSDTITLTITVWDAPKAAAISGPQSVCTGSSIQLTASEPGGTWSLENDLASISSGGVLTGRVGDFSDIVYYTVSSPHCGTYKAAYPVTIRKVPAVYPVVGRTVTGIGGMLSLVDFTEGGAWSSSNTATAAIDGAGHVTGISAGTTIITYAVTNECGTGTASQTVRIGSRKDIKNAAPPQEVTSRFKIYPNPNQGLFTLELPEGTGKAAITISDISGKTVANITTSNTTEEFNLRDWARGIYVISVQANGKIMRQKLVVE